MARRIALDKQWIGQIRQQFGGALERAVRGKQDEGAAAGRVDHRSGRSDYAFGVVLRIRIGQTGRQVRQGLAAEIEGTRQAQGNRIFQAKLAREVIELPGHGQRC
jgi:hypothetical protein